MARMRQEELLAEAAQDRLARQARAVRLARLRASPPTQSPRARILIPLAMLTLAALLAMYITFLADELRPVRNGPVYTVTALRAHLAREPDSWLNRPLRVHALAGVCIRWMVSQGPPCVDWLPALADPGAPAASGSIPLEQRVISPLATFLRRLPLAGWFVPSPKTVSWGMVGIFDIQLRRSSCDLSGTPGCYEALLLDVEP
jgi:hypothetical protein